MSYVCNLFGELTNISLEDVTALKDRFKRHMHLDTFEHKKDQILVIDAGFNNRRKIGWLEKFVYQYIADTIPLGRFEKLYFREGTFFSCIFFGHKQFEIIRYNEPERPEWWQGESISYIHALKDRIMELLRKGAVLD
ncbi:MAG: hypothetical protein C4522_14130 [Desulfobacteraceae bacterium]|nr:MAG: hypothetical protein C4522_14130 [Desulfobacteraceae bacterium]